MHSLGVVYSHVNHIVLNSPRVVNWSLGSAAAAQGPLWSLAILRWASLFLRSLARLLIYGLFSCSVHNRDNNFSSPGELSSSYYDPTFSTPSSSFSPKHWWRISSVLPQFSSCPIDEWEILNLFFRCFNSPRLLHYCCCWQFMFYWILPSPTSSSSSVVDLAQTQIVEWRRRPSWASTIQQSSPRQETIDDDNVLVEWSLTGDGPGNFLADDRFNEEE